MEEGTWKLEDLVVRERIPTRDQVRRPRIAVIECKVAALGVQNSA